MTGLPTWTKGVVPTHVRLALAFVGLGAMVCVAALQSPHGPASNVALTLGSLAVTVGLLLGAERSFRLRSHR
jgi:hypothetical protein